MGWGAVIGGLASAATNLFGADRNIKNQKEYAQHGISWKVADAKRAGIHPLAAIGANTMAYSPVSIGDAGQNISSSVEKILDKNQRNFTERYNEAVLKKLDAETKAIMAHAGTAKNPEPPFPEDGVETVPKQVISSRDGGSVESGMAPAFQLLSANNGKDAVMVFSQAATDATEEDTMARINLWIEQYGLDAFTNKYAPSYYDIKPYLRKQGYDSWRWTGRKFTVTKRPRLKMKKGTPDFERYGRSVHGPFK